MAAGMTGGSARLASPGSYSARGLCLTHGRKQLIQKLLTGLMQTVELLKR